MNREQYIKELARHLAKLPPEERVEALRYYEEYFYDAGEANEQTVIQGLGNPKKLAAGIRADSAMRQYAENMSEDRMQTKKQRRNIVAVVLLCIFAAPVGLPVALSLFVVVLCIFIVLASLLVSCIAIAASGLVTTIAGLLLMVSDTPTAVFYIGSGLMLLTIGIIAAIGMIALFRLTGRGFITFANRLRHGGRIKEATWQSSESNEDTGSASVPSAHESETYNEENIIESEDVNSELSKEEK